MIKRSVFNKIGNFREDMRYCQDWEFWLRCVKNNYFLFSINQNLGFRNEHSSNLSNELYLDNLKVLNKSKEVEEIARLYF
jgi:hypothetical protein